MLINWMKRIGSARLMALTLLTLLMGGAMLDSAEARIGGRSRGGGGFGSFGSRGSRTFDSGQGAARMSPLPGNQGRDPLAGGGSRVGQNGSRVGQNGLNQRGSWLQRNPLLGGIMGAIAGTLIGAALISALGGMGNFGNILMILLVAGAAFAIFKLIMARKQSAMVGSGVGGGTNPLGQVGQGRTNSYDAPRQTPYSAPNQTQQSRQEYLDNAAMNAPSSYNSDTSVPVGNAQTRDQGLAAITLGDATMTRERLTDALSSRFFQIQEAWSNGDRQTLQNTLTGELHQEFGSELSALERRGERNIIKNIVIRRFDISEAWQEGDVEFVTAHISARLLDYTQKGTQIVAGDAQNPTDFSEFWTFVRMRGRGEWILSAINQEA